MNHVVIRTSELLTCARNLIASPSAWHQGYFSADCIGRHVEPTMVEACRWCPLGALEAAAALMGGGLEHTFGARALLNDIAQARGFPNMPIMNDSVNHETVIAALNDAIRLTIKQEAREA